MILRVLGYKVSLDDDSWGNRVGKLVASVVVTFSLHCSPITLGVDIIISSLVLSNDS